MFRKKDSNKNYGQITNCLVGASGIIVILIGILIMKYAVVSTILLSIGTSMLATAIVTKINSSYMLKTLQMENLLTTWQLHNIYETKSEMNILDANEALSQCHACIDIIAEGLSNYRAVKENILKEKILHHNVTVRIISCDSEKMLKLRFQDETGNPAGDDSAVQHVIDLEEWVRALRDELGSDKDRLQIRYHSSYPGLSYLKIDSMLFVSANLWKKPSQQSFALNFNTEGKGGKYFVDYFQSLWDSSFVHETCRLQAGKQETSESINA